MQGTQPITWETPEIDSHLQTEELQMVLVIHLPLVVATHHTFSPHIMLSLTVCKAQPGSLL